MVQNDYCSGIISCVIYFARYLDACSVSMHNIIVNIDIQNV